MIYTVQKKVDCDNEISLIFACASFSWISGLHHWIAYFAWNSGYLDKCVKSGFNVVRWVDYGVTSGLMFAVISILFTAPPDFNTLVLAFVAQTLVIVGGAASEALWSKKHPVMAKWFFIVAGLLFLVPWVVLFLIFGIANADNPTSDACGVDFPPGTEKKTAPDFVWGAIIGLFVTFASFAVCHAFKICEDDHKNNIERLGIKYEYVYGFLSFSSKIILLGNIASGIVARSDNNVDTSDMYTNVTDQLDFFNTKQESDDDIGTFWYFFAGSVGLALGLGVAMLCFRGRSYFYGIPVQDKKNALYRNPAFNSAFNSKVEVEPILNLVF